ncbi:relaxase/mobilization nuclease domain-containing protein [Megalodesulfovibrio paquesii]
MISRRIQCKPGNDNYRRLANYIAGAGPHPEQDKVLFCWTEGCWAGDDYEWGIHEIVATQDMNLRSQKEKTYHLIVSFRPEDNDKLTPEIFKEIEQTFAAALGWSHCAMPPRPRSQPSRTTGARPARISPRCPSPAATARPCCIGRGRTSARSNSASTSGRACNVISSGKRSPS